MQKTMKELPLNETNFNGSCVALPLVKKSVCELSMKEPKTMHSTTESGGFVV